jgi:hypothetical protein
MLLILLLDMFHLFMGKFILIIVGNGGNIGIGEDVFTSHLEGVVAFFFIVKDDCVVVLVLPKLLLFFFSIMKMLLNS